MDNTASRRARSRDFELTNQLLAQVQIQVDHRSRRNIAAMAAELARQTLPLRFGASPGAAAGTELARNGVVSLGQLLSAAQIAEVRAVLADRPLYKGHVFDGRDQSTLDPATASRDHSHACHSILDVLACPHLIEMANSDAVLAAAESYLGCAPTLYSMSAFWSYPAPASLLPGVQTFHRDWDDFRFCTLFVFLTDTGPNDGVHEYVMHSHEPELLRQWLDQTAAGAVTAEVFDALFRMSADVDPIFPPVLRNVTAGISGAAGTAVVEDTFGLHRGLVPMRPRLLFWARYGLHANKTYMNDGRALGGIDPAAMVARVRLDDDYYAYVNRLLLCDGG